jgi:hypothetical protein
MRATPSLSQEGQPPHPQEARDYADSLSQGNALSRGDASDALLVGITATSA